jgi:hypothetical protein
MWSQALCDLREGKVELDSPRDSGDTHARAGFPASAMFTRDLEL